MAQAPWPWTMIASPGGGCGQGSGASQRRGQSRPCASRWRSHWMPGRTRLTRRGRARARDAGGARSRAGGGPRSPHPRAGCRAPAPIGWPRPAPASAARPGPSRCGASAATASRAPSSARKPSSTHALRAYQLTPTRRAAGRCHSQGSSWSLVHAATRVTVRRRPFGREPSGRPRPRRGGPGPRPGSAPDRRGDRGPPPDAQQRVPAEVADALPQPRAPQAAVGQSTVQPGGTAGRGGAEAQDRPSHAPGALPGRTAQATGMAEPR